MPKKNDLDTKDELPKALMVRLPPDLHAAIRNLAEEERRSLNSQFIILVEIGLKQLNVTLPTTQETPAHAENRNQPNQS